MKTNFQLLVYALIFLVSTCVSGQNVWDPKIYEAIPVNYKKTIFYDAFNDNRNNWEAGDGQYRYGRVENGYYLWGNGGSINCGSKRAMSIGSNVDFEIEAMVKIVKAKIKYTCGIIWGCSQIPLGFQGQYFHMTFNRESKLFIGRWDDGSRKKYYSKKQKEIKIDEYNKLTVRKYKDKYYFFINEVFVKSIKFQSWFGQDVGFLGSINSVMHADYLRISEISNTPVKDQVKIAAVEPRQHVDPCARYSFYSSDEKETVFLDDFDDNRNKWWTDDVAGVNTGQIEQGHYYYASYNDNWYYMWQGVPLDESRDFELESEIKTAHSEVGIGSGFLWGKSSSQFNMYLFCITDDNKFFLSKYIEKKWQNIVNATYSQYIHSDAYNKVSVRKIKDKYYFFINGFNVHTMPYKQFFGPNVGYCVAKKSSLFIDNLRISYLNKGGINLPPVIVINEPNMTRGVKIIKTNTILVTGHVTDTDGIKTVSANGIAASLNTDASFSVIVPVVAGENRITVTAVDNRMKAAIKVITVNREPEVIAYASAVENVKRLALVIGNARYSHGGSLRNPVNDARAMKVALELLGFTVLVHENCDQKAMKRAMDEFGKLLEGHAVGLFFYAGHGIQVNGHNYLVPVDASLNNQNDVEYDCVRAGRLLAKMESAGTQTNIVILDACRDNPFERSWSRSARGKGLAFMDAPSGSLIAYATSPGTTAADGSGSNGVYTSAILQYIHTPGITIEELFKRVRRQVKQQSGDKQTPWESTSLEGNFYFKR
ncbi:caspase family protein [bacterium]|nr:caspase family protein [bacterium]